MGLAITDVGDGRQMFLRSTQSGGSDGVRQPHGLEWILNGTQEFDLSRPVYSLTDAAEILAVNRSTLGWWLEGGERRGRYYGPVIRAEATGETSLTWPEFVEAGLLRQYRRELRVRLH